MLNVDCTFRPTGGDVAATADFFPAYDADGGLLVALTPSSLAGSEGRTWETPPRRYGHRAVGHRPGDLGLRRPLGRRRRRRLLAACHAAIDAGVNWIDTADIYGQGRAERIVGQAVRERRDEVVVATKGGVAWESGPPLRIWRARPRRSSRAACDRSLAELGLDRIDLYQALAGRRRGRRGTIGALEELRRAGKVRAIGVSNYALADLQAAQAVVQIDSFQPGYHLMRRDIEAAELAWCRENGVGVIAYGLRPRPAHREDVGRDDLRPGRLARRERAVRRRRLRSVWPWRASSTRWRARPAARAASPSSRSRGSCAGPRSSAIVGARTAEQAVRNAALAASPLTADEEAAIEAVLARHPAASGHYGHGEPPDPSSDAAHRLRWRSPGHDAGAPTAPLRGSRRSGRRRRRSGPLTLRGCWARSVRRLERRAASAGR